MAEALPTATSLDVQSAYRGTRVLITGGLGFLGRNLAAHLLELGAKVTLASRSLKGITPAELASLGRPLELVEADILDRRAMDPLVAGQEVVFSLAGHSGPVGSLEGPYIDLDINCRGALNVLEACRVQNPQARIVFPGSRQEFGRPLYLPVDEGHPIQPVSIYGIHKFAGERYHVAYAEIFGLSTVVLRISNPYGPHPPASSYQYNVVNGFIDKAVRDEEITIFGDGSQVRDYVYVGDVVDALARVGAARELKGAVFNLGGGRGVAFLEMARAVVRAVGSGTVVQVPWPEDYRRVETGDYVTDNRRITRAIGWQPGTDLETGLALTVASMRDGDGLLWRMMRL